MHLNISTLNGASGDRQMPYEKARWEIVKRLLDEFPSLRERVKRYLENET